MLAGITSRSTHPQGRCGDGGIYTRVDKYMLQVRAKAKEAGSNVAMVLSHIDDEPLPP